MPVDVCLHAQDEQGAEEYCRNEEQEDRRCQAQKNGSPSFTSPGATTGILEASEQRENTAEP
jgi:hypothetical protein